MVREFSVLRVRSSVLERSTFPLTFEEFATSPLAGAFDGGLLLRLRGALDSFADAHRVPGHYGLKWHVQLPRHGALEVVLTSDGSLFLEGPTSLFLVGQLFLHLMRWVPTIVLEDRISGVLHNRESLLRLARREEESTLPFALAQGAGDTAWLN